jgi:hypothetical protein
MRLSHDMKFEFLENFYEGKRYVIKRDISIIFDEISMIRADYFDYIDYRFRYHQARDEPM